MCAHQDIHTHFPKVMGSGVRSKFLKSARINTVREMAMVEDPVKLDPKHYKVEFENDKVRTLRITYGPGEKSVMHDHPNAVAVFLTDGQGKFTYPDGRTEDINFKAGQTVWFDAVKHLPESKHDKPFQLIFVEFKK